MFSLGSPSFVVKRTNSHAKHVYPRSPGMRYTQVELAILLAGIYGKVAELLGKVHIVQCFPNFNRKTPRIIAQQQAKSWVFILSINPRWVAQAIQAFKCSMCRTRETVCFIPQGLPWPFSRQVSDRFNPKREGRLKSPASGIA